MLSPLTYKGEKMTLKNALLSGVMLGCAASALPASAQQLVLEEIVVTAKQREQNLQEVPLAITVFSTAELDRLGVDNVQDLAQFTPNFNIYSGNGRHDASGLNVRGLSANTSDERYQPVSFFVDGIFMGGLSVGLETLDVERIEVLKGPQSAAYGRATYAGAIDFITTTPSLDEFGGKFTTELSSNKFDNFNYDIAGYIEGPIIENKLSASLFVKVKKDDGFDQAPGAQFDEVGQNETLAMNAVIFSQLGENTTLKLRGIYSGQDDQHAMNYAMQPAYWEQEGANIITLPSGALFVQGVIPDPIRGGIIGIDIADPTIVDNPQDGGYERDRYFGSAIVEHDFDNGMNLSYRGAYLWNTYDALIDFRARTAVGTDPIFGSALPLQPGESPFNFAFPFAFQEEFEDTSHQLRLLSSDEERLRWSVGAYYYWSADSNFQKRNDRAAPDGNPDFQSRGTENIINLAAFGSVQYDVTDQLTVGFEGRIQEEEVRYQSLAPAKAVSSGSDFLEDLVDKTTSFEPRLTVDYAPNDDQMFYAMFAKGVKSGRWNTTTTVPLVDGFRPVEGYVYAPPEKLFNYELGSKSTLMDGAAILNIAVFYQDIKDQQLRQSVQLDVDLNGDGGNDIVNQIFTAGDSRIYGFEIEGTVQVTEKLTVRSALGYSDHEFADDIPPSADFDLFDFVGGRTLKGKTSVNVPKLTATANIDYVTPVFGGDFDWRLRSDIIYTGKKYTELANLAQIDDFFIVNARTSLETEDWIVNLFINNVLDDETAVGSGLTGTSFCEFERNGPNLPAFNPSQRCIAVLPQRGREWGVSATLNF